MPCRTPEAETDTPSCWAIDYWLRRCEGYRVWNATDPIGYVEAVLTTEDGEPHSLVVRVGSSSFSVLLTYPVAAVEGFDPGSARVFVGPADTPAAGEDRQLTIPTAAQAGPAGDQR